MQVSICSNSFTTFRATQPLYWSFALMKKWATKMRKNERSIKKESSRYPTRLKTSKSTRILSDNIAYEITMATIK